MAIQYYLCQWGYTFSSLWKQMNNKQVENDKDSPQGREETQSMVYQHTKLIWDLLLEERRTGTALDQRFVLKQPVITEASINSKLTVA